LILVENKLRIYRENNGRKGERSALELFDGEVKVSTNLSRERWLQLLDDPERRSKAVARVLRREESVSREAEVQKTRATNEGNFEGRRWLLLSVSYA
jgi:hypothetical protein